MPEAAAALGRAPRRVFLTVGRLELRPSRPRPSTITSCAPSSRSAMPCRCRASSRIQRPRPIRRSRTSERCMRRRTASRSLVTKNSGGAATYGKIAAARDARACRSSWSRGPQKPDAPSGRGASDAALAWLEASRPRLRSAGACRRKAARHRARHEPRRAGADDDERRHVGRDPAASASVRTVMASSARPTARAKITGVSGPRTRPRAQAPRRAARAARTRSGCRARSRNRPRAPLASAARSPSQGLRLSESEMAQKSPPSGAPTRAAAASIAVMPGSTVIGRRARPDRRSSASNTAAAMANTPGSPPETTATRRPSAARPSAKRARSSSTRLSEAWRRWPGGAGHAVEIGAVADEIGRVGERLRRRRREPARIAGAEADDGERAGRAHTPPPETGHEDHREVGRLVVRLVGERADALARHGAALHIDGAFEKARRRRAPRGPSAGGAQAS